MIFPMQSRIQAFDPGMFNGYANQAPAPMHPWGAPSNPESGGLENVSPQIEPAIGSQPSYGANTSPQPMMGNMGAMGQQFFSQAGGPSNADIMRNNPYANARDPYGEMGPPRGGYAAGMRGFQSIPFGGSTGPAFAQARQQLHGGGRQAIDPNMVGGWGMQGRGYGPPQQQGHQGGWGNQPNWGNQRYQPQRPQQPQRQMMPRSMQSRQLGSPQMQAMGQMRPSWETY